MEKHSKFTRSEAFEACSYNQQQQQQYTYYTSIFYKNK